MVIYYSATGNSLWVAREIAERQGERLISATEELKNGGPLQYTLGEGEAVGFVFPIHAWNPPDTLLGFISRMEVMGTPGYIYAVATCGDSSGYTMRVFEKALQKRGWRLDGSWELQMPNNYLPMQDVDSPEVEREKLANAGKAVEEINGRVAAHSRESKLMEDRFPAIKTSLIGFFFRTFGKSSRPFYVTEACNGCGLCQKICLKGVIGMEERQPRWAKGCDQCYACINRCPQAAIQYGKKTETRGRYCHPALKNGAAR